MGQKRPQPPPRTIPRPSHSTERGVTPSPGSGIQKPQPPPAPPPPSNPSKN